MPERFGHHRVVEKLGQGGMGAVYLGIDTTLDRKVALKVLRTELRLEPDRKARLLREARILSQLNHPGVCQLYEFIDGEDADCLVLELVEGVSLRDALESGKLDHPRKLGIAGQMLDVLIAVHGKGVIHRDLTPNNVMLTPSRGVKLLDFGLARSLPLDAATEQTPRDDIEEADDSPKPPSQSGVDAVGLTAHGAVVGTAGYMSPEQARGRPATAASDMYSFGLILQEMFTGRSPFADDLDPVELRRRAMWAETEPIIGMPGDLTTMIERLTSLAPGLRPSAVDAAAMLQHMLDRPRRRRRRATVAAVWLTLAAFGAGMTIQYLRAEREAERAEEEATASDQVSRFLVELFQVSDPGRGEDAVVTARELLDNGAAKIEHDLAGQPVLQARMLHTMGVVYHHLGDYDKAQETLAAALVTRKEALGEDHPDVAATLFEVALVHRYLDQYDEAQEALELGLGIAEGNHGRDSVESARFLLQVANLADRHANSDDAEAQYHKVLSILEQDPEDLAEDISATLGGLADLYLQQARFTEAEPLLLRAIEIDKEINGADTLEEANHLAKLGFVLVRTKRFGEAEQALRRSLAITEDRLGAEHPFTARSTNGLAYFFYSQKQYDEASSLMRRALHIYQATYGPEHPNTLTAEQNLGAVLIRLGKFEQAEKLIEHSLESSEKALGADHPSVAYAVFHLARVKQEMGDLVEAERLNLRTLTIREQGLGSDNPLVAETLIQLARCLRAAGREGEAEGHEARARAILGEDDQS